MRVSNSNMRGPCDQLINRQRGKRSDQLWATNLILKIAAEAAMLKAIRSQSFKRNMRTCLISQMHFAQIRKMFVEKD